jgi:4-alpha-glucanotransferase
MDLVQRDYLDNAGVSTRLDAATVRALSEVLGEPPQELERRSPLFVTPQRPTPAIPDVRSVEAEDGSDIAPADLRRGYAALPHGYHRVHTADGPRDLIVSPGRCRLPERRMWGWTVQLYAARARGSWGIGDFGALGRLGRMAHEQGAGFLLVNPLHAGGSLSTALSQQASPYYPSSRRFLSPLYLDIDAVPGATRLPGERLAELHAAGRELNGSRRIDRDRVWALKSSALREIFEADTESCRSQGERWRRQRGPSADEFATWSVLADRFRTPWPQWPSGARLPDGPISRQVAEQRSPEFEFAVWLQSECERQLRDGSRNVAVLQDLPIGVDPQGADGWAYQRLLALEMAIGAPPDPFNQAGQDWGLPPFNPWRLQAAGYQPFIEAIRATMALSGGLRIDHVMGLFRLWWVPRGTDPTRGGYVRYPADDLLDIVALESERTGAPVVGEDLGTVEPGVREHLADRNVLSYRLFWFADEQPSSWPVKALAAVETHDLPTIAGLWDGSDLAEQRSCGLDADEEATDQLRARIVERARVPSDATADEAVRRTYRLLAQAPSLLLGASLEDGLAEPRRPNMPGTADRANWSTALPVPVDELGDHPGIVAVAEALHRST